MRLIAENLGEYLATDRFAAAEPVPALAGFAAPALTLPDLGVPSEVVVADNQQWWIATAILLLDAGIIKARGIRASAVNPYRIAQEALDGWIGKRTGQLNYIGLVVNLSDSIGGAVGLALDEEEVAKARSAPWLAQDTPKLYLGNEPQRWGFVRLQKAYEALEAVAVGLGRTVWFYLDRWLAQADLNAYTPGRAEDDQCNYRWWGENDESEVRAQYGSDEEFAESGCLTRAEFDRQLPTCVVRPRRGLSLRRVREVCRSYALGTRERELLRLFWRGLRLFGKREFDVFPAEGITDPDEGYLQQLAPAVFVRWNDADPVVAIFDDMASHYQSGSEGYYEGAMGFNAFALDDSEALRQWLPKANRYFRAVGLLDRMLTIIEGFNQ